MLVRGFTLIELLISVGIMVIMTISLLGSYPDSSVKAQLASYNNSLSILLHETQIRGSSIDSVNGSLGGYGLFFDRATSSKVIFFGDKVDLLIPMPQGIGIGNGLYDTSPVDEAKSVTTLLDGFSYKKLCIGSSTASILKAPYGFLCNATSTPTINTLTISFIRPSQVAHIYINGTSTIDYPSACIQVYSRNSPAPGHIRSVKVYHSGMMIAGAKPCD
jgi:prepilin-type N-terminal cleavage/methylation domain-containing protein